MNEKTLDTLVEDKNFFEVKDRKYELGKLSAEQYIKLARYLFNFSSKISKDIAEQLQSGNSNASDILIFLDNFSSDEIAKIESILLSEPDTEFLKKNLDFEKLTELIAILIEKNDFEKILGNVKRIAEAIKK